MLREPIVAGRFYQDGEKALLNQIKGCFEHPLGIRQQNLQVSGKLKALILPHAGYVFSGPPASYGFARLKQEKSLPTRIILLGPKHTHYGPTFSVSASANWKTPLGLVEVDKNLCDEICRAVPEFELDSLAHEFEHSLEVQLPFLQYIYQGRPLKIVPIALGYSSFSELELQIGHLKAFLNEEKMADTIILVSSDFSHDTPREQAYRLDSEVIEKITALSAREFYDLVVNDDRSVCGLMPITALLLLLQQQSCRATLLTYSTSMDVMEHDRGVGYAAIAFEEN